MAALATTAPADLTATLSAFTHIDDESAQCLVKVQTPDQDRRTPTDVCCVVDVSGSMNSEARISGAELDPEARGLSLLDITKHAVRCVVATLGPQDRFALVAFSSTARVALELTPMSEAGKALANAEVAKLAPKGQTNLWHGLQLGLDQLQSGRDAARLASVLLLTDGLPNVVPPRGHVPMLERYAEQHDGLGCTVSTFGFGYRLDSELLGDLATTGGGAYAFIPDPGFVGTAFVHATSNVLATAARDVVVTIRAEDRADPNFGGGVPLRELLSCVGGHAVLPCLPEDDASLRVQLGSLQFGQTRDLVLRLPKHLLSAGLKLQATVDLLPAGTAVPLQIQCTGRAAALDDEEALVQCLRSRFCDVVTGALTVATAKTQDAVEIAQVQVAQFADEIGTSRVASDKRCVALLDDVNGQVTEAFSRADYLQRWGVHFLPSLVQAHRLQQANNFKDPGVQLYGGQMFRRLRDEADDLFNTLPPPEPSRRPESNASSTRYHTSRSPPSHAAAATTATSGGGGATPQRSRAVNMSFFNSASNPCFAARCRVALADGSTKPVKDLAAGDIVRCALAEEGRAEVVCVVETRCAEGKAELVSLPGGLLVTPWHPVRVRGQWTFPVALGQRQVVPCDSVVSVVLRRGHMLEVEGTPAVALGHGLQDERFPELAHEFWGTTKVVDALRQLQGWPSGRVLLHPNPVLKDPTTGLAAGLADGCEVIPKQHPRQMPQQPEAVLA